MHPLAQAMLIALLIYITFYLRGIYIVAKTLIPVQKELIQAMADLSESVLNGAKAWRERTEAVKTARDSLQSSLSELKTKLTQRVPLSKIHSPMQETQDSQSKAD